MAEPCACHSPYQNYLFIGEKKLASAASTEGNGTFTPIPAMLRTFTLAPAIVSTIALSSDNKLFKQFIKTYLKAWVSGRIALKLDPKPHKQYFKACFPDFY